MDLTIAENVPQTCCRPAFALDFDAENRLLSKLRLFGNMLILRFLKDLGSGSESESRPKIFQKKLATWSRFVASYQ